MEGLHTVNSAKERWLYGKSGPEGCFLPAALQFRRFSFSSWKRRPTSSIISHSAIHKDTPAISGDAEIIEYLTGNLHGRYASNGRVQTEANRIFPVDIVSARESMVDCQLHAVHSGTISVNRVSGDDCELHVNGFEISRRENKENPAGSSLSVKWKAANCLAFIPASRQTECNLSCSSNGPLIIPLTVDLFETDSIRQSAGLSSSGQAVSPSHGRPSVVAWSHSQHPW